MSESAFTFTPRPEAYPMNWAHLLPPVQRAVRALLLRIDGATRVNTSKKEAKTTEIAANCFLVYGDRGTGKTTVLLSAKDACMSTKKFFGEDQDQPQDIDEYVRDSAIQSAKNLQHVIWLDVLDLEPLQPRTNLLTTVLTRVRNALDPSDPEKRIDDTTSILEEGVDSARHKLKQLINDATLMWEDIHESDTRSRANRQIAAADIYADYQDRFREAIDTLSLELGRRSGRKDEYCPIVLPIDNIDRSTEHLYSIVKLAQMAFSPRLWFVMAGDRQDVDTFLERAYWKELIRIGEGAGGTGKVTFSGEDEALVMARRQGAAASHKLLPPSHRVEVGLVQPKDTLAYKPPVSTANDGEAATIRDLLASVCLINTKENQEDQNATTKGRQSAQTKISLIHLFDKQCRPRSSDRPLGLHEPPEK